MGEWSFYENIYKVCRERGTNPTAVLKAIGSSAGNTSNWKHGSVPNVERCNRMANHLGVSLDYLVNHRKLKSDQELLSESDKEWLRVIHRIPEEKQQMCMDFLKTHIEIPEKFESHWKRTS